MSYVTCCSRTCQEERGGEEGAQDVVNLLFCGGLVAQLPEDGAKHKRHADREGEPRAVVLCTKY